MPSLTSVLGVDLPVVQAPMAGVQDEALAIAVAKAGGLGSMPCALLDSARLETALQRFAVLDVPINLNFFCHDMAEPDQEQMTRWREPARGLVNRLMRELGAISPLAPAFPWASQALAPLRAAAEARGLDDFTPLWSGAKPGTFSGTDAAYVTRELAGHG